MRKPTGALTDRPANGPSDKPGQQSPRGRIFQTYTLIISLPAGQGQSWARCRWPSPGKGHREMKTEAAILSSAMGTAENTAQRDGLERGLGLKEAVALNMIEIVGIGPFVV